MSRTLLCITLLVVPLASTTAEQPQRITGTCMGTTYTVTIADETENTSLKSIEHQVSDELERIEQIFSLYRTNSELSRLNAAPAHEWIGVSADLLGVSKRSLELARQTNGAFDPTIGPLMRLWRLRQVTTAWSPPTAAAIAKTRQQIGYEKLDIPDKASAIRKNLVGLELDLNALVEGWAIDRIINLLQQRDIKNALVELGGEFRSLGHKTNGQPWKIGLENPLNPSALYATAAFTDAALATSGNYRQTIEHQGRRYGHILDARTGEPVQHNLIAVSVIADDALTADGWATALLALGPNEGLLIAEKHNLIASFVSRVGPKLQIKRTKAAATQIILVDQ